MWNFLLGIFILAQQTGSLEKQRAALEKQKASVRRQVKLAPAMEGTFFVTMDPSDKNSCLPLPLIRREALLDSASKRAGVPVDLLAAVIAQESGFRPCSVSPKGALGLMQLMPATADDFGVGDPMDPDQNVQAGAALLRKLLDRYGGDLNRALGAYNAGPRRVDEAGGVPAIPETMKYVEGILGRLQKND